METLRDAALIKELQATTDYKFLNPAASNKLQSIKQLPMWFSAIVKMLVRFPDPEAFLFGTTASLNNQSELQLRTIQVKQEFPSSKKEDAKAPPSYTALVLEELQLFGQVLSFARFDNFLEGSSYRTHILADNTLKHLIAPALFPRTEAASALLTKTQQFRSPEYEETVTLGDNHGLTLVSDQRKFIFPSEQRITNVKAVTFHYAKNIRLGDCSPERIIHQLLRPHFWRWLNSALTGTDFAHLLTLGWECDHTWIFGRLIEQADNEREESDQLFAILAVQDELRTKASSENLMSWYVKALKTIDTLNAITRTYRKGCGLMILPAELVESMYKIHAHREGYSEVMSRVARDNQGYMPIAELQKAIANIVMDKNRQASYSNFSSGKVPKAHAKTNQVTITNGNPKSDIDCCYKFLEGKCQEAQCTRPHIKVPIPPGVCAKYLADNKSCDGSCKKLHERWSGVVRKLNDGTLHAAKDKSHKGSTPQSPKKDKAKQVTSTTTPTLTPPPPPGGGEGRGKGGRGRGRGGRGHGDKGGKENETPKPPKSDAICSRCEKPGHEITGCWASNHADGSKLTSAKPVPVPEKFKKAVTSIQAGVSLALETDDEYDGYDTVASELYEAEESVYWPTHRITVCARASVTAPPTILQKIDSGIFQLVEVNLTAKACAARWLACNTVGGHPDQGAWPPRTHVPILEIVADSATAAQVALPSLLPQNSDWLQDDANIPSLVDSDSDNELGGGVSGVITNEFDSFQRRFTLERSETLGSLQSIADAFTQPMPADTLPDAFIIPASPLVTRRGTVRMDDFGEAIVHWDIAEAFTHTELSDDELPPLVDLSTAREVIYDHKEGERVAPGGLIIAPLVAPPTCIVLQEDSFDWEFCTQSESSTSTPVVRSMDSSVPLAEEFKRSQ